MEHVDGYFGVIVLTVSGGYQSQNVEHVDGYFGVIMLTVSGGYQSQSMEWFPLTYHLGADFDYGNTMGPGDGWLLVLGGVLCPPLCGWFLTSRVDGPKHPKTTGRTFCLPLKRGCPKVSSP